MKIMEEKLQAIGTDLRLYLMYCELANYGLHRNTSNKYIQVKIILLHLISFKL